MNDVYGICMFDLQTIPTLESIFDGHAMAQAVSCWHLTTKTGFASESVMWDLWWTRWH
jgi:hypothetical protein